MPVGGRTFAEALKMGTEVFHHLKQTLKARGMSTAVGDEGGFAPDLSSNEEALKVADRHRRSGAAGYVPGDQVAIALDPAVSELYKDGAYVLEHEGRSLSADELGSCTTGADLAGRYPILSIEDGMDEEDLGRAGRRPDPAARATACSFVGDDLFVTNTDAAQAQDRQQRRQLDPDPGSTRSAPCPRRLRRSRLARESGLHGGDLAPVGRDRGRHDRRSGGGHRSRADQDRGALADRSRRQVQPAAADRGSAGVRSAVPRPVRVPVVTDAAPGGARQRLQAPVQEEGERLRRTKALRDAARPRNSRTAPTDPDAAAPAAAARSRHELASPRPLGPGGPRPGRSSCSTEVVAGLYVQHALAYLWVRGQAHQQQAIVRSLQRQNAALAAEQRSLRNPATVQRRSARARDGGVSASTPT